MGLWLQVSFSENEQKCHQAKAVILHALYITIYPLALLFTPAFSRISTSVYGNTKNHMHYKQFCLSISFDLKNCVKCPLRSWSSSGAPRCTDVDWTPVAPLLTWFNFNPSIIMIIIIIVYFPKNYTWYVHYKHKNTSHTSHAHVTEEWLCNGWEGCQKNLRLSSWPPGK